MVYRSWLWVPMVALVSACSGAGQTPTNQTGTAASNSATTGTATSVAETSGNQATPKADAAPGNSSTGATPPSLADIGLKKGVYSQVSGEQGVPDCPPALAVVATFDGKGFGSRNSADCRFDPVSRDGAIWKGTQHCTDPASKTAQNEAWKIRIDSPTRYTRLEPSGPVHYALCPAERLSDWGG